MDNKEPRTIIFPPGKKPPEPPGLQRALAIFKIPGIHWLSYRLVMRYLPRCKNVEISRGFRAIYGNIVTCNSSLSDTFFQDYADVVIGEGTAFSYQCMVLTAAHDIESDFRTIIAKEVIIGKNVWIASRAIILGGAQIGDGAVIGAGSVVTGKIPPGVLAVGVPARPIKKLPGSNSQLIEIK